MRYFLLLSILVLSACGTPNRDEAGTPPPSNYRDLIAASIHANFRDPYSMHDVALSEPMPGRFAFRQGWRVCLQANAKNAMGGYTGIEVTGYFFEQGALTAVQSDDLMCQGVTYAPWSPFDVSAQVEHGRHLGVKFNPGDVKATVASVDTDSPAAVAGVQPGDQITSYAGNAISTRYDLVKIIGATPSPGTVPVTVLRAGQPVTLTVAWPPSAKLSP